MKRFRQTLVALIVLLVVIAVGVGVFIFSGLYNVAADDPHSRPVFALMQTLRERSLHERSNGISVPDLRDEQLIRKGASEYAEMCTECHLKPGMKDSEIRSGLYPQPPNLSQQRVNPQDAFWVIKHGLKMSAMPAWGMTHDDATIWSMVAFLQRLPDLTPKEYSNLIAKAPSAEDLDMSEGGHHHHPSDEVAEGGHGHHHGSDEPGEARLAPAERAAAAAQPGDVRGAQKEMPLSFDGLRPNAAPAAEGVAHSLQQALQKGDREAALALLTADGTISEGGRTQSRTEYASGHLAEDIAFLKRARLKTGFRGSSSMGETAFVGSETLITTAHDGKRTTLRSRELLTLRRQGAEWKIARIQWQSAPARGQSD